MISVSIALAIALCKSYYLRYLNKYMLYRLTTGTFRQIVSKKSQLYLITKIGESQVVIVLKEGKLNFADYASLKLINDTARD